MEELHLEHLPESHTLLVALFQDVTNSKFLQRQLLDANAEFEYAFIDATVIVSRTHALAAAFRALNDMREGRLRSRNVHSETVFCLSPNNNITESFRRFGIGPNTTALLIMKISTPTNQFSAVSVHAHLTPNVRGKQVPFTDEQLHQITDWKRVCKIYKLPAMLRSGTDSRGEGDVNGDTKMDDWQEAEMIILGAMALRGVS